MAVHGVQTPSEVVKKATMALLAATKAVHAQVPNGEPLVSAAAAYARALGTKLQLKTSSYACAEAALATGVAAGLPQVIAALVAWREAHPDEAHTPAVASLAAAWAAAAADVGCVAGDLAQHTVANADLSAGLSRRPAALPPSPAASSYALLATILRALLAPDAADIGPVVRVASAGLLAEAAAVFNPDAVESWATQLDMLCGAIETYADDPASLPRPASGPPLLLHLRSWRQLASDVAAAAPTASLYSAATYFARLFNKLVAHIRDNGAVVSNLFHYQKMSASLGMPKKVVVSLVEAFAAMRTAGADVASNPTAAEWTRIRSVVTELLPLAVETITTCTRMQAALPPSPFTDVLLTLLNELWAVARVLGKALATFNAAITSPRLLSDDAWDPLLKVIVGLASAAESADAGLLAPASYTAGSAADAKAAVNSQLEVVLAAVGSLGEAIVDEVVWPICATHGAALADLVQKVTQLTLMSVRLARSVPNETGTAFLGWIRFVVSELVAVIHFAASALHESSPPAYAVWLAQMNADSTAAAAAAGSGMAAVSTDDDTALLGGGAYVIGELCAALQAAFHPALASELVLDGLPLITTAAADAASAVVTSISPYVVPAGSLVPAAVLVADSVPVASGLGASEAGGGVTPGLVACVALARVDALAAASAKLADLGSKQDVQLSTLVMLGTDAVEAATALVTLCSALGASLDPVRGRTLAALGAHGKIAASVLVRFGESATGSLPRLSKAVIEPLVSGLARHCTRVLDVLCGPSAIAPELLAQWVEGWGAPSREAVDARVAELARACTAAAAVATSDSSAVGVGSSGAGPASSRGAEAPSAPVDIDALVSGLQSAMWRGPQGVAASMGNVTPDLAEERTRLTRALDELREGNTELLRLMTEDSLVSGIVLDEVIGAPLKALVLGCMQVFLVLPNATATTAGDSHYANVAKMGVALCSAYARVFDLGSVAPSGKHLLFAAQRLEALDTLRAVHEQIRDNGRSFVADVPVIDLGAGSLANQLGGVAEALVAALDEARKTLASQPSYALTALSSVGSMLDAMAMSTSHLVRQWPRCDDEAAADKLWQNVAALGRGAGLAPSAAAPSYLGVVTVARDLLELPQFGGSGDELLVAVARLVPQLASGVEATGQLLRSAAQPVVDVAGDSRDVDVLATVVQLVVFAREVSQVLGSVFRAVALSLATHIAPAGVGSSAALEAPISSGLVGVLVASLAAWLAPSSDGGILRCRPRTGASGRSGRGDAALRSLVEMGERLGRGSPGGEVGETSSASCITSLGVETATKASFTTFCRLATGVQLAEASELAGQDACALVSAAAQVSLASLTCALVVTASRRVAVSSVGSGLTPQARVWLRGAVKIGTLGAEWCVAAGRGQLDVAGLGGAAPALALVVPAFDSLGAVKSREATLVVERLEDGLCVGFDEAKRGLVKLQGLVPAAAQAMQIRASGGGGSEMEAARHVVEPFVTGRVLAQWLGGLDAVLLRAMQRVLGLLAAASVAEAVEALTACLPPLCVLAGSVSMHVVAGSGGPQQGSLTVAKYLSGAFKALLECVHILWFVVNQGRASGRSAQSVLFSPAVLAKLGLKIHNFALALTDADGMMWLSLRSKVAAKVALQLLDVVAPPDAEFERLARLYGSGAARAASEEVLRSTSETTLAAHVRVGLVRTLNSAVPVLEAIQNAPAQVSSHAATHARHLHVTVLACFCAASGPRARGEIRDEAEDLGRELLDVGTELEMVMGRLMKVNFAISMESSREQYLLVRLLGRMARYAQDASHGLLFDGQGSSEINNSAGAIAKLCSSRMQVFGAVIARELELQAGEVLVEVRPGIGAAEDGDGRALVSHAKNIGVGVQRMVSVLDEVRQVLVAANVEMRGDIGELSRELTASGSGVVRVAAECQNSLGDEAVVTRVREALNKLVGQVNSTLAFFTLRAELRELQEVAVASLKKISSGFAGELRALLYAIGRSGAATADMLGILNAGSNQATSVIETTRQRIADVSATAKPYLLGLPSDELRDLVMRPLKVYLQSAISLFRECVAMTPANFLFHCESIKGKAHVVSVTLSALLVSIFDTEEKRQLLLERAALEQDAAKAAERERIRAELELRDKLERERLERERLERERLERERLERERLERERVMREKLEKERELAAKREAEAAAAAKAEAEARAAAAAATTVAVEAKPEPAVDDVDALLGELAGDTGDSAAKSEPEPEHAVDDVDALLGELAGDAGDSAAKSNPSPSMRSMTWMRYSPVVDGVDALLDELAGESRSEPVAATAEAQAGSEAQQKPVRKDTAQVVDDVDALLGELASDVGVGEGQRKTTDQAVEDVDALLGELAGEAGPGDNTCVSASAAAAGTPEHDDVNALLDELGGAEPDEAVEDVDALLNELGGGDGSSSVSKPQPNVGGEAEEANVDVLLGELSQARSAPEESVDDLLQDLDRRSGGRNKSVRAPTIMGMSALEALVGDIETKPGGAGRSRKSTLNALSVNELLSTLSEMETPRSTPFAAATPAESADDQEDVDSLLAELAGKLEPVTAPDEGEDEIERLLRGFSAGGDAASAGTSGSAGDSAPAAATVAGSGESSTQASSISIEALLAEMEGPPLTTGPESGSGGNDGTPASALPKHVRRKPTVRPSSVSLVELLSVLDDEQESSESRATRETAAGVGASESVAQGGGDDDDDDIDALLSALENETAQMDVTDTLLKDVDELINEAPGGLDADLINAHPEDMLEGLLGDMMGGGGAGSDGGSGHDEDAFGSVGDTMSILLAELEGIEA
ncbi:uncharacterized protein AMSG_05859 [Thecamonas trahens ATCC 50062]|uniref:Uncharacterized protein n=1 Tax=Thecamonas trahens ATCC 50062 TaxID=461836 RepID=A0A0L0DD16_THETB|nr:hypothetical protein AMSG_05859 [Thecamonas trahens ATCC 50062]KNC50090.1 hypothetical protein AMSG_05859 [Thecamonas trahens ATCC 50062]|eukprot:XP_013757252.1 hypothetical protein AMSG_05859 [Thecamonas trahens ATCC 50062]